jgi:SAM-dependent methyltransferase
MLNKSRLRYFPALSRLLTRLQYEFISAVNTNQDVLFMNFGFADPEDGEAPVVLKPQDEVHRYPLQLYHHLARHIEWKGAEVLEVSSGRGGGASFIMRHFKPRSYLGVDFSTRAVAFCRTHHEVPGLSFEHGNAEALRFPDNSFDVIVNVEASLYYPHVERFFQHVKRILKPGGHFLYADLRFQEDIPGWMEQIKATGLSVIKRADITDNILKALELDRERRISLVNAYAPGFLRKKFYFLVGLVPDLPNATPRLPNRRYWYFILQKG